jgi:hypothetical protein
MTMSNAVPSLTDFVAAFPGPAEIQFRGGSITVVAILFYADGIRIEWQMPSAPHHSPDEVAMDFLKVMPKEGTESQEFIEAFFRAGPMRPLWAQARLSDDHGREFGLSLERSGPLDRFGGAEGTAICRCEPPSDSKALTLHLGGADIVIPLTTDRRPQDGRASLFKAGYPGPKNPIPFHDGAIKLVATLIYEDLIRIEWLVDPVPDLSFLFKDTVADYLLPTMQDENERLAAARWTMNSTRTIALWMGARLADDLHTPYVGSLGPYISGTGLNGQMSFKPSAPPGARELNLVLHDLSVRIPLVQNDE